MEGDIRALVTRWTVEAIGAGRVALTDSLIAPNFVAHQIGKESRVVGPHAQRMAIEALHAAFAELQVTVENIVVSGNRAAVHDRVRGIHKATFAGIEPRGKRLDLMRMTIYRVDAGKIRESWAAVDMLAMLKQLGGRN